MKTILEINVEPFIIPAYVSEQTPAPLPVAPSPLSPEKYQPSHRTFALRELSVADLDRLIEEFAAGVYKVAGKKQPTTSRMSYEPGHLTRNNLHKANQAPIVGGESDFPR